MSQFQALRCCSCEKFQVHQVKKAKKWDCRVCGEKQSYIKVYYTGSAKECRLIVQKFNFEDGEKKISQMLNKNSVDNSEKYDKCDDQISSKENIHKRFKKDDVMISREDASEVVSILVKPDNTEFGVEPLQRTIFDKTLVSNIDFNTASCASAENYDTNTFISSGGSVQEEINKELVLKVNNLVRPARVKNMGFQKILEAAKRIS